jgi:5-methyltetrahydropteroyltriglutamate--homocysteine methyltransferase
MPIIERAVSALGAERVMLGPSCSLLHCPVDVTAETALPEHIRNRMAFAVQKCAELPALRDSAGRNDTDARAVDAAFPRSAAAHPDSRIEAVRERTACVTPAMLTRRSAYPERQAAQAWLALPLLPTTTIGSFPQTQIIRKTRLEYKRGDMPEADYVAAIRQEIKTCVEKQEQLGLDVLVHGEAERNDMVEYFGEQLAGFCFTQNGWVQSYGSRCVKPPVIYGDVYRRHPMTISWILYAQSLTQKPVKGMLTGPVTFCAGVLCATIWSGAKCAGK